METYRIQFKLRQLTDIANPWSWFLRLRDRLSDQLFIDYPMYDPDDGVWRLTKLITVKKRTEVWADIILDKQCWVWLRLRGRGKRPPVEALEKAVEWANTVAEVMEKIPKGKFLIEPGKNRTGR